MSTPIREKQNNNWVHTATSRNRRSQIIPTYQCGEWLVSATAAIHPFHQIAGAHKVREFRVIAVLRDGGTLLVQTLHNRILRELGNAPLPPSGVG